MYAMLSLNQALEQLSYVMIQNMMSFIFSDVFMVGPFTPKPAARLPEDLENFMQSSGDAGVVVISFGSAISSLSHHIIGRILMAISNLKQKFIWKVERKSCIYIWQIIGGEEGCDIN